MWRGSSGRHAAGDRPRSLSLEAFFARRATTHLVYVRVDETLEHRALETRSTDFSLALTIADHRSLQKFGIGAFRRCAA
jgi:hypothetical protein